MRWMNSVLFLGTTACLLNPSVHAQNAGIRAGGTKPDAALGRPGPAADPTAARILSAEAFQKADVATRRSIMTAWTQGTPESAGHSILPMIDAGLRDEDNEVKLRSLAVVGRIASASNLARHAGKAVGTDLKRSPGLYDAMMLLVDNRDAAIRSAAITSLTLFYQPPREDLEIAILERFATERAPLVRTAMIVALGQRARLGSRKALSILLSALDESGPVRLSAVSTMQHVRAPEALPRLVNLLDDEQAVVRRTVIRTVAAYGQAAKPYETLLKKQLESEKDPEIKNQLNAVIAALAAKAP